MNLKRIATGALMLVLAVSSAFASCASISLLGDHFRQVEQYQEISTVLIAVSECASTNYTITVFSSLPVRAYPKKFTFGYGKNPVILTVSPGSAEPGLYTVHVLMESEQDIAREEFVVKVIKTENPLLIAEAPTVMSVLENDEFDITIAIENKADTVLNNVVVFIDEAGEARRFSHELESLQPGERKNVNFHYEPRPPGEYILNYTAASGDFVFRGQVVIASSIKNYPFLTTVSVREHDKGYILDYTVNNIGPKRANDLFLTVEDAPLDWQIISPSAFSLAAGETKQVELLALYGDEQDAVITLALYEGQALRAEDKIELSQARLRGTGLISLGSSFTLGILVLLLLIASFLAVRLHRKSREKNVSLKSLMPDWAESLWPF